MPSLTLPITSDGVIIEALVSQPSARERAWAKVHGSAPSPDLRPVRLMVDTGALVTFLNPNIIEALGITQSSMSKVQTSASGTGTLLRPAYLIALVLKLGDSQLRPFDPLLVTQCNVEGQGIDGMLGCDVLNEGRMVWDGAGRRCILTF